MIPIIQVAAGICASFKPIRRRGARGERDKPKKTALDQSGVTIRSSCIHATQQSVIRVHRLSAGAGFLHHPSPIARERWEPCSRAGPLIHAYYISKIVIYAL
ncbi:protein of unknown function [Methylocella tundrae]|uniref:Uncharacterized protein n=1 Tax=Methylocella tundrae TaxID=227605 RepID=A0A4U8Z451_METTU|nr:protein of unknown function [Methylocella tundrae]